MTNTDTTTFAPATVAARFGKTSTVVHLASGSYRMRFGRPVYRTNTTVPNCGTYTRVGGAAMAVYEPVTCSKCLALNEPTDLAPGVTLAR